MSEEEENINPNEEEEGKPAAAASPLSAASAASAFVDDEELEASVTLENLSDEEAASLLSSAQQSSSDVKNGEVSRSSRSYASWEYDDFCFDSSEDDDNADQTSPTPAAGGRLVVLFSRHAPQLGLGPFGRKRSMVSILHDRELGLHGARTQLYRLRYKKCFNNMAVVNRSTGDERKPGKTFVPINQCSEYLGLSPDSTMLVELSATVTANVQHEEEWEEEGEGDEQVQYSLVVYHVTPGHLHPLIQIPLPGHRQNILADDGFLIAGDLRAAFPHEHRKLLVAYRLTHFDDTQRCPENERILRTFDAKINLVLFRAADGESIHISAKIILARNELPWGTGKTYLRRPPIRFVDDGLVIEADEDVLAALLLSDRRPSSSSEQGQTTTVFRVVSPHGDEGQPADYRQGSLFEKILAHRCAPVGAVDGVGTRNHPLRLVDTSSSCDEELAEPGENGKKPLFVSEVLFSATHMLHGLVERILEKQQSSDHPPQFTLMGVTGANVFLISVRDGHVCRVLIVGVVEVQAPKKYTFQRVTVDLDWDLRQPSKICRFQWRPFVEIDWRMATVRCLNGYYVWQPSRLFPQKGDRSWRSQYSVMWDCHRGEESPTLLEGSSKRAGIVITQ